MTRALGLNHVALEVGDVDEALAFYGRLFEVRLRGRSAGMAFIDLGDQFLAFGEAARGPTSSSHAARFALGHQAGGGRFIALSRGRRQAPDDDRHVGLVVDDVDAVRAALAGTAATIVPTRGLRFLDPWGNAIEVVAYRDIQYTKAPHVLRGMGVDDPGKSERALAELDAKGMTPGPP